MSKIIEIIVAPDGSTKVVTKGYSGGECRQASRPFEDALGARQSEELTAEFYGQVQQGSHIQEQS